MLDFGLASLLQPDEDSDETQPRMLTKPGATLGTPNYMAPEQISRPYGVDGRADTHALGAVIYYMITGRAPFGGRSAVATLMNVASARPVRPGKYAKGIDPDLEALIMRCMEKEPGDRFASAQALADELDRLIEKVDEAAAAKPTNVLDRTELEPATVDDETLVDEADPHADTELGSTEMIGDPKTVEMDDTAVELSLETETDLYGDPEEPTDTRETTVMPPKESIVDPPTRTKTTKHYKKRSRARLAKTLNRKEELKKRIYVDYLVIAAVAVLLTLLAWHLFV